MNIQFKIVDIYDDPQLTILKDEVNGHSLQERDLFTKCASSMKFLSEEERENLRDHQYALRVLTKTGQVYKKFPVNDVDQIWLSSVYFIKTAGELPTAAQAIAASNIAHSARVFGLSVPEQINKIAERYQAAGNLYIEGNDFEVVTDYPEYENLEKIARDPEANDTRYWGLSNGKLRYPLSTPEQVKVAAVYLDKNERAFTPEERHEFATKIAARGHEYGIIDDLRGTPVLHKYAGPGMDYGHDLKKHLAKRKAFSEIDEASLEKTSSMNKLASTGFGDIFWGDIDQRIGICREKHIEEPRYETLRKDAPELGMAKTAMALIHLDKNTGLSKYWGKSIQDPYAAVYGKYHVKTAQEFTMFGDQRITRTDLLSVKAQDFINKFGDSVWNEFQRNPLVIFESMPSPEKAVIAGMIANPVFIDSDDVDESDADEMYY